MVDIFITREVLSRSFLNGPGGSRSLRTLYVWSFDDTVYSLGRGHLPSNHEPGCWGLMGEDHDVQGSCPLGEDVSAAQRKSQSTIQEEDVVSKTGSYSYSASRVLGPLAIPGHHLVEYFYCE